MEWEKRSIFGDQLRALDDEGRMALNLFAMPFNSESRDLGGFTEVIPPDIDIRYHNEDVFLIHNHNWDLILARQGAGTMQVDSREDGVYVEARLEDTTFNRDLFSNVRAGNIAGASFSFATDRDEWRQQEGRTVRTLRVITVREFSTTPIPAYGDTDVGVALRSLLDYSHGQQRIADVRSADAAKLQAEAIRLLSL